MTARRSGGGRSSTWTSIEKSLLRLHGSSDLDSFWRAVQKIIQGAIPDCSLGLSLQRNPVLRITSNWTRQIPYIAFGSGLWSKYLRAHLRIKFVRAADVFLNRSGLLRSAFYRQHMAPQRCIYAFALIFWNSPAAVCVIIIMRSEKRGDLNKAEINILRRLHPQFQTALRRLRSSEREHSARMAFEEFLSCLPLPTMLLRWNLKVVYQNQAALEFFALWERGPDLAGVLKTTAAAVPAQILEACRRLKQRWEKSSHSEHEIVHNVRWPDLRVTLTLKQLNSTAVAQPHFLIECENLAFGDKPDRDQSRRRLPHLVRLTVREQQVVLLVCEGRSNSEIAEDVHLSLPMVKKHLYTIFRKLEVSSRSRLMTLMR